MLCFSRTWAGAPSRPAKPQNQRTSHLEHGQHGAAWLTHAFAFDALDTPRLLAFLQIHASLNEVVTDGAVLFFKSFQGARGFCGFRSFFEVSSYFLVLSLSLPALLVPCRCLIACNPAHQPAQFSRSCLVHVCNKGRDVGESQRQTRAEDNLDWMEDERATALHFDKKRHCHCRSGVSF